MKKYILALDEGTTSTRSILFDFKGNIVHISQKEFTQFYPKEGWVEQDPVEIYASLYSTITDCIISAEINPKEIAAIGITNQRETTIVWDKNTGIPVYNAIVWQCRRTAPICEKLVKKGLSEYVRKTTGLKIDAYFSGTKIKWILDNCEGAKEKAKNGDLLFGTIDTWIAWKLTNGNVHVTDYTNASRTMLYDIHNLKWDERLLKELGIPASMLPSVKSSSEIYGYVNIMGVDIPIAGIAGDQQAALFGQKCFYKGTAKNTYGTGCFLLMNTGTTPFESKNGLITTMAATIKDEPNEYALEGSVFIGGDVIKWLRDELGFIRDAKDSEYFANKVEDCGSLYIVPAFAGLGAPYWNMYAKGTIVGMSRSTTRDSFVRAALEAIAYQSNDLIEAMQNDTGITLPELKVDGGASRNKLLMNFQADISNLTIVKQSNVEATALGAAYLAGLATGVWKNKDEIINMGNDQTEFKPTMDPEVRTKKIKGWKKAVQVAMMYTEV